MTCRKDNDAMPDNSSLNWKTWRWETIGSYALLAVARHGEKKSAHHGYVYESLAPEKANRVMEPFIVTLMPAEGEFSTHDGQEFIFVLDGVVTVQVGNQAETLKPGDAAYYDSNLFHLVKAGQQKRAQILAVLYPESR